MNIGINDDYAVLIAGDIMFYYGYEYTDSQDNWKFIIKKHGEIIYSCLAADLGYKPFDNTAEILLAGIGKYIESGNRGDTVMKFMTEQALQGNPKMSQDEVEKVAQAIKTLADIWELSYEEMTERMSEYMTEKEYNRVSDEIIEETVTIRRVKTKEGIRG